MSPPRRVLSWLVVASFASLGLAIAVGPAPTTTKDLARALGGDPELEWLRLVLLEVRLPRAIVAWLVGASLGASGCALQGLFRNPLADPAVLGVSSSAAFMAQLVLFAGFSAGATVWMVPVSAMLGALLAVLALAAVVGSVHHDALETLVLAGVALGQVAIAGSALLVSLALADFTVAERLIHWMLGSLDGRTWMHVAWGAGPVAVGCAVLFSHAPELDALLLGDVTAMSLGVHVVRLRRRVVFAAALLTGISVAIGGIVAFVGLIVPHALRRLLGATHGPLVASSVFGGGALVVVADVIARRAAAPMELQIGVVTAALGAPWFAVLLGGRLRELTA